MADSLYSSTISRDLQDYSDCYSVQGNSIGPLLNLATRNTLDNALLIANLTQLRSDCSIAARSVDGIPVAIASYYMDLPFNSLALLADNNIDAGYVIRILANRHLKLKEGPTWGLYTEKTVSLIESTFGVINVIPECQMVLRSENIPELAFDKSQYRLEQLTTNDMVQISRLYSLVPAMAWTPKALNFGPYYGVYYGENLVSIAGVHFSTRWSAEIGNVVTHPKHRRSNLAYATTRAVAEALRKTTDTIFLCVMADNEPALRLYQKMGFVTYQMLYLTQFMIA